MKKYMIIFLLLLPVTLAWGSDAKLKLKAKVTKDTPSYNVVAEYIRSLGAIHDIQVISVKENEEVNSRASESTENDDPLQKVIPLMMNAVRSSAR